MFYEEHMYSRCTCTQEHASLAFFDSYQNGYRDITNTYMYSVIS